MFPPHAMKILFILITKDNSLVNFNQLLPNKYPAIVTDVPKEIYFFNNIQHVQKLILKLNVLVHQHDYSFKEK